jgi:subtilisin-like proprotein convertase family protein
MSKRLSWLGVVGLALVAILAVGASPAVAKKAKKKTVTLTAQFNQCVNVAVPYNESTLPAVAQIPVTIPAYRGLPQDGAVTAVTSVGVRASHTFVSDNVITLVSPSGRLINLFNRRDNGGDNFGAGATSCSGTQTLFSDTAGTAIAAGAPPYAGSFRPEQPLSGLNGSQARGVWTLLIADQAAGDSGTLHAFSLNFTYSYLAEVKKKKKK